MLGEKIGEMSGKINSQRVLPNPSGGPKMETSFQGNGSLLGTNVRETGTYWTVMKKDGSATYRGAIYYQTTPPRLSRLNKVAVLFEYAVDAEGDTHSEYWEWK